jgi:26S proteasome regulatory subunit N1
MILLWDTDSGLAQLDKYLHSNDTHVVAGALLGIGIVTCGVKNDCDPVCAPPVNLSCSLPPYLHLLP